MAEALLFQWDALPRNFAAERRCLRGVSEQRFAIAGNLDEQTGSKRGVAF
jgi:hypothetical protein